MTFTLSHIPQVSLQDVERIATEFYGLEVTARPLPSERDQNFLLRVAGEKRFILKIANALEDDALLEAQNLALEHLKDQLPIIPELIPTVTGQSMCSVNHNEARHTVRLLSYLPGQPLARQVWQSEALLVDLGRQLGRLDHSLADFDHPALHRDFHWDLAKAPEVIADYRELIQDTELRQQVELLNERFICFAKPFLAELRQSVIHNDANDYNILVTGNNAGYDHRLTGLIDYGDMLYSHTVNELAIAIAYAVLDKPEPLKTALPIAKGYHQENPLSETELKVLFPLIGLRLAASVSIAAYQQTQRPEDDYLGVSQAPIRNTLPKLLALHPNFVEASFRHSCGLEPVATGKQLTTFLASTSVHALLPEELFQNAVSIDLSVGSPDLPFDTRIDQDSEQPGHVFHYMMQQRARLGIGRYNEPRLIYTTPSFITQDDIEKRSIHLGLDVFAEVNTPIYAPLEGKVFALGVKSEPQDYGHVLILEHHTPEGRAFYTLYGHLAASVSKLSVGQVVKAGEQIALVGDWHENGGWAPHLHLQIIGDLLGLETDFPGVCSASERAIWTALCPNPNLLVRLPETLTSYQAAGKAETLSGRQKRIGRNLSIGYRQPLKMLRGRMQYLYDDTGSQYLDAYNNVPHVGHCHPRVVAAASAQLAVLNTNTRYLYDGLVDYAEKLCTGLPEKLGVCYFVNSGSEANELALRLARAYTESKDMIVLEGAYHGHTTSLIDISPYKHDGPGGSGAPDWVHTVPVADIYRGVYKEGPDAGRNYAQFVKEALARLARPASFIAETCPSVGGQIIFPQGYLAAVYEYVRQVGGICIADEVQTAYGRTGTHFYAFEAQGVVPDIVILGKPIGNGYPLAAVITTSEIAEAFDNGMEFFSTFGGSTVSCQIGMAVLDVVQEEKLQAHAFVVGQFMLEQLKSLKERFALIGDVRGSGLFLGIELVRDRQTLEPAAVEASFIVNRMRDHGILMGTDGPLHNVIKIRPPMPFNLDNAAQLVETLERLFGMHFAT